MLTETLRHRWIMAGLGAFAGLSLWALGEAVTQDALTGRWAIFAFALTSGFFASLLAFAGQMRWREAVLGAGGAALAPAALLIWASQRYEDPFDVLDMAFAPLAAFALGLIALPFVLARASGPHWRDYAALFGHAWGLTIRALAALVFLGVVWVLIFLSDALLSLVGVTFIGDLLRHDVAGFLITGTAIGLSLAVISDLNAYISPDLLIRLLRLLAPVVLVVTGVFLLALPFKGLSNLFGGLSSAAILLAMAAVSATMVSLAIDRDDANAAESPVLHQSARGLAVAVLLLSGFGAWAIWLRVAQYGLTPERLMAMLTALVALGYGLGYVVSVLRGRAWMAGVRQTNVGMALVMAGLAALTMTPILDGERLSANSQMGRAIALAEKGEVAELWALQRWGRAGKAALQTLEEQAKVLNLQPLTQALAAQNNTTISYGPTPETKAEVKAMLPVQPASAGAVRDDFVDGLDDSALLMLHQSCGAALPGGTPGCVLVVFDALPDQPGDEALLVQRPKGGGTVIEGYVRATGSEAWVWRNVQIQGETFWEAAQGEALIATLQAGQPILRSFSYQALVIDRAKILFSPVE